LYKHHIERALGPQNCGDREQDGHGPQP
jgi:hypothetical protein